MRLSLRYHDFDSTFQLDTESLVFGRPKPGLETPEVDLSPDRTVSRPHARFFLRDGQWWLEDLGSAHGTQLNGREIRDLGPQRVRPRDTFQCGETKIKPDLVLEPSAIADNPVSQGEAGKFSVEEIGQLTQIYDLLLKCGAGNDLDGLMREIVARVVDIIPQARRGALLLHSLETDSLLLAGFRGEGGPAVSETLARRALREKRGLLWRGETPDSDLVAPPHSAPSLARFTISSAALAPLICQDEALGVLCIDNPEGEPFTDADLSLLQIVAHHLALGISNRRLREDLRRESNIKSNLLRQFSPQYREQLLNPGGLKLSGERGEVTVMVSDIRGFESIARHMEPVAVIEMLNDYFSRLSPIIWAHNGSIDKYIGDAILAVFGSPNKDPKQHENALRAAYDMQAEMAKSNEARAKKGKVTCEIGIGIHCGEALHGFMGVLDQFSLTVIGDAVNRASRYCDGAKGGEIIMSPQVYQWVWKDIEAAPTQVVTKHGESLPAFRLAGFGDPRD